MPIRAVALLLCCLAIAACQRPEPETTQGMVIEEVAGPQDGGAISTAPVKVAPAKPEGTRQARTSIRDIARPEPAPEPRKPWAAPLELTAGVASISCELDYVQQGDGEVLTAFDRDGLKAALAPCEPGGVARLRYKGKVTAEFGTLVERVTEVADSLDIGKRVLDIDSAGGQVEDAIQAGDYIAESRWTIWVREGAICHSACVFILSAGDTRMIAGQVGIHRIIRMSSTATTRAQLNAELRVVYERVRDYLERNGAATAVADLMMAVPNRSLRLLTTEELELYGLDGVNPAQDDLDRLRLMRKCGEDFVTRRDSFVRAFDKRCKTPDTDLDALNACGLKLRTDFGFPDQACPSESPLSEFDRDTATLEPPQGTQSVSKAAEGKRGGDS
ncbi:hypothetical protein [Lysobacter auxotrophicus]|uniref:Secreted protein n=1 Tax=Lysobacter auxotrophicus TaxID=2992573 RepID=A0ABM8DBE0_9GAMM|nr:hypothetical protein [Lysobacter auxotrophicus]BDU15848.1 hypothetical protein LA521A_10490 [Lysobacter auxotrophicus]